MPLIRYTTGLNSVTWRQNGGSMWRVLLDPHAAAVLAPGDAVQPGRVPDQRHALGLLRPVGRRPDAERGRDLRVHARVSRRDRVGVQDRHAPQAMKGATMADHEWNEHYASGNLPWDTGVPDEQLVAFVRAGKIAPGAT